MDSQQVTVTTPARDSLQGNSLNPPRLALIGPARFSPAPVIYLNVSFRRRPLASISLSAGV